MTWIWMAALWATTPDAEVVIGQKGHCLTVFQGHTVEPFDFVVRGVMQDFLGPGLPVVVVRLLGEKPEFTGVVAGMSGSPCFIGDRLIGALGYSFAMFAKEPIAGITPIGPMRAVHELPEEKRNWRGAIASRDNAFGSAQPIATPLTLVGVPGFVQEAFAPWFEARGLGPMAAGGSGTSPSSTKETLVPGDAVAVKLIDGDVNVAATGTVTTVDGNRVLAFGHPFQSLGAASLPMCKATIVNTMASAARSFKMSNPGAIVGEFVQDRLTAIAGILGSPPPMLEVQGTMHVKGELRKFRFSVARDPELTPQLLAMGLASVMSGQLEMGSRGRVIMDAQLLFGSHAPVAIHTVHSAEGDGRLFLASAMDVSSRFTPLWQSQFGVPPQAKITVDITVDVTPLLEEITSVHVAKSHLRVNERLQAEVTLRADQGPSRLFKIDVPIAPSWKNKKLSLQVMDAKAVAAKDKDLGTSPEPQNFEDILEKARHVYPTGKIYVRVVAEDAPGARVGDLQLGGVPPTAVVALGTGLGASVMKQQILWSDIIDAPGAVVGKTETHFWVARAR